MAAFLETPDNSEKPREDISSEFFLPKDTLDQPCDVILVIEDGKQFKAHRNVLSEASPFFEKLLNSDMKESKEGIVCLEMFSEAVTRCTLEFIYTGHVQILTEDNARDLIVIADYLFLEKLKTLAEGFLIQRLNVSTCFSNYFFSERHRCEELFSKTRKFILANFSAVYSANQTGVLNMSSREIEMLISSDEINVSAEEEVFNVILSWIDHDKKKRKKYFAELFRHVRLVYVSRDFLCSDVETSDLVTGSKGCFDLVVNAMKLIKSRDFSNLVVKPRNSLETSVLVIQVDQDLMCYFPRENKWCHLGMSFTSKYGVCIRGIEFVSCRGKLHGIRESPDSSLENRDETCSLQLQQIRYEPFLDEWMVMPYTGKRNTHVEQIFVTKQDEVCALVTEACMYHGLSRRRTQAPFCDKEKHFFFITKYKHESNSWEDISSFDHLDRSNVCIVATDNFIYFLGGSGLEYSVRRNFQGDFVDKLLRQRTDVDRYDLRKNQWSKVADLHEGYKYLTGGAVNENIFIVGQSFYHSVHCEVYDETTNEWQVIASPRPFSNSITHTFKLFVIDGKLYTVRQYFSEVSVYSYDPAQDKWNNETGVNFYGRMMSTSSTSICSMRIYKAFLSRHQLKRLVRRSITAPSASSDQYKCFIV